jgi:endonuclease/exonuclease/phosphatase family metal-dependent hydrolase
MRFLATPATVAALAAVLWASLAPARNYAETGGPRYAGRYSRPGGGGRLRVVTFNLRFAREIDRATSLFRGDAELSGAHVVALQEMDAPGVDRLARALGYDYVYYPAAFHPTAGRDFGNAVLVRGRILADHKLLLPHPSRSRGLRRIAVAADVEVGGRRLRVYSAHLETPAEIWPWQRREQVEAILSDARGAGPVVIAGDFNDRDLVGPLLEGAGYRWVSRGARRTVSVFAWDHVFARGLDLQAAGARSGVVRDNLRASDHRPVWAELAPARSR